MRHAPPRALCAPASVRSLATQMVSSVRSTMSQPPPLPASPLQCRCPLRRCCLGALWRSSSGGTRPRASRSCSCVLRPQSAPAPAPRRPGAGRGKGKKGVFLTYSSQLSTFPTLLAARFASTSCTGLASSVRGAAVGSPSGAPLSCTPSLVPPKCSPSSPWQARASRAPLRRLCKVATGLLSAFKRIRGLIRLARPSMVMSSPRSIPHARWTVFSSS